MLYAIVSLLVIILDQWVKLWVGSNLVYGSGDYVNLIPNVLHVVNCHNEGAAFSFLSGANAKVILIAVCAVFTVAIIVVLATGLVKSRLGRWSLVMIMAGGISNCIDRILWGYVQDMFEVQLFSFAVFNVADIFITVFCVVLIFAILFGGREKARDEDYDDGDYDEDDWEDDDDEEEEEERPRRRVAARKPAEEKAAPARRETPAKREESLSRRDRQAENEARYAQLKAARQAREQEAGAAVEEPPVRKARSAGKDPFAEWEQAMSNDRKAAPARTAPAKKPTPVDDLFDWEQEERPAPRKTAPVEEPASVQEAPAEKPVKKTAPAKALDDFDLDDILAEFK